MTVKMRPFNKIFIGVAIILVFFLCSQAPWKYLIEKMPLKLEITLKIKQDDALQLFYLVDREAQFSEKNSIKADIQGSDEFQTITFDIPSDNITNIRVDTGSLPGQIGIKDIKLKNFIKEYIWKENNIKSDFQPSEQIANIKFNNNVLFFDVEGNDPYLVSIDISKIYNSVRNDEYIYAYSYLSILLILFCIIFIFINSYKKIFAFLRDIIQGRKLIFELAKKDLQTRYLGSYLGVIWAFIQPVTTILVFWFVFQVGFKSAPVNDVPFILWLICGMIPWFFFSDSLISATNSVLDNAYLVKKVVFKVSVLPIIRIISALFIHLFFIFIIFIMMSVYGYPLSIFNIQVVYYLLCTIILVLGLSWLTSSLVIFLKDLGQIIGILIQFGFWLTPIFWSYTIMPAKYQHLLKLNPLYYIIQGYRDSFINHVWFWNYYNQTVNFWIITSSVFIIGALLFRRLRPHFADVL